MRLVLALPKSLLVFAFAVSVAGAADSSQTTAQDKQAPPGGDRYSSTIRLRVCVEDRSGKLIADGALARDPAAARHALTESIELVKPLREGFICPMLQDYHGPALLMAMLVPVAERIDLALAREAFWRALSLRVSASGEGRDREKIDVDTCLLANLLGYYDREIAESLMKPVLARSRSRTFAGIIPYYWMTRWLILDSPDRALVWADSLSDLPAWNGGLPREVTKQSIANMLTRTDNTESNPDVRVKSELTIVQNAYGAYVERD